MRHRAMQLLGSLGSAGLGVLMLIESTQRASMGEVAILLLAAVFFVWYAGAIWTQ